MRTEGPSVTFTLQDLQTLFDSGGLSDNTAVAKVAGVDVKTVKRWKTHRIGRRDLIQKVLDYVNKRRRTAGLPEVAPAFMRPAWRSKEGTNVEHANVDDDAVDEALLKALRFLRAARAARDGQVRASLLEQVVGLCDLSYSRHADPFAMVIASQALRLLAAIATTFSARASFYKAAFNRAAPLETIDSIVESVQLAVDLSLDPISGVPFSEQLAMIADVRASLDKLLRNPPHDMLPSDEADVLTRRSSLLRAELRLTTPATLSKRKSLAAAERDVQRALALHPSAYTQLESLMIRWELTEFSDNDEEYALQLRRLSVELDDLNRRYLCEPALLAAIQLHRKHFSPLLACRLCERLETAAEHSSRLHANAELYADAALLAWHDGYLPSELRRHLERAARWTQSAIAGGFSHARNIVNHVRLLARIGRANDADAILRSGFRNVLINNGDDLAAAVRTAVEEAKRDPLSSAFAIGITDAGVLTTLGTAMRDIYGDDGLAGRMYELALDVNKGHVVANTNMARWCLDTRPSHWHSKCRSHLVHVEDHAPRSFRWWRGLRHQLERETIAVDLEDDARYLVDVADVERCRDTVDLFEELVGGSGLRTTAPHILLTVVRRLADFRYSVEVKRSRTLSTMPGLRVCRIRIYDRDFVVVGADINEISQYDYGRLQIVSRQRRVSLVLFSITADETRPTEERAQVNREMNIVLTEDDLIRLLEESTTIDRLLYAKYSESQMEHLMGPKKIKRPRRSGLK